MGLATLVAGLERAQFLGTAAGVEQVGDAGSTIDALTPNLATIAGGHAEAGSYATLDSGVESPRIDRWVTRLTTSLRGDFQQSLQRMEKYEG